MVYAQCRTETEGQPRPVFTLFGDHKDNFNVNIPDILQQVQDQLGPVLGGLAPAPDIQPPMIAPPGYEQSIDGVAGFKPSPEPLVVPSAFPNQPPPSPQEMMRIQDQLRGVPPNFSILRLKAPKSRHVHKVEASIGLGLNHRGLQVVRIHDVSLVTDEVVAQIEKAIAERLAADDGFLDEFVVEFNGGYGCGPKLSEEEEFIRKQIKKQKRDFDEENKWRGDEDQ